MQKQHCLTSGPFIQITKYAFSQCHTFLRVYQFSKNAIVLESSRFITPKLYHTAHDDQVVLFVIITVHTLVYV